MEMQSMIFAHTKARLPTGDKGNIGEGGNS